MLQLTHSQNTFVRNKHENKNPYNTIHLYIYNTEKQKLWCCALCCFTVYWIFCFPSVAEDLSCFGAVDISKAIYLSFLLLSQMLQPRIPSSRQRTVARRYSAYKYRSVRRSPWVWPFFVPDDFWIQYPLFAEFLWLLLSRYTSTQRIWYWKLHPCQL